MWLTNTGKKSRLNINKTKKLQRVPIGAPTPIRTLISEDSSHYPQRLSEIFCLKHGVIKSYHEVSRISRTFGLCYAIHSPFLLLWHNYRLQGRYAQWAGQPTLYAPNNWIPAQERIQNLTEELRHNHDFRASEPTCCSTLPDGDG